MALLVAHVLTQSACSPEAQSHADFANGECAASERNYRGFCLPDGGESATTTDGITGRSGDGGRSAPPRDGGSSGTAPGDASGSGGTSGSAGAGASAGASGAASEAGQGGDAAPDSGAPIDPECEPRPEVCDGRDDDCDGRNDEQSEVSCYDAELGCAPDGSGGHACSGLCRAGVRRCSAGELGDCEGEVAPAAADTCTGSGELAADEDCDGRIDEGCSCSGESQTCYSGEADTRNVGPCRAGMQTCGPEGFGACEEEVLPSAETCANPDVDDDCDGDPDDVPMLGNVCTVSANMGLCASGVWQCAGGALACATPSPVVEICDRRDQDCDGHSDEDFDLQTDTSHCGMCGRACSGAQDCCGGSCANLATSNSHCGACGMACASGQSCCGGACRDLQNDEANCGACGRVCANGQSCCGGSCIDTSTNADHCGACGNDCGTGLSCCGGTCFNLDSAQDHCGTCTRACGALEGCCRGGCKLLSLGC